jgi:hypothetical protein
MLNETANFDSSNIKLREPVDTKIQFTKDSGRKMVANDLRLKP